MLLWDSVVLWVYSTYKIPKWNILKIKIIFGKWQNNSTKIQRNVSSLMKLYKI